MPDNVQLPKPRNPTTQSQTSLRTRFRQQMTSASWASQTQKGDPKSRKASKPPNQLADIPSQSPARLRRL